MSAPLRQAENCWYEDDDDAMVALKEVALTVGRLNWSGVTDLLVHRSVSTATLVDYFYPGPKVYYLVPLLCPDRLSLDASLLSGIIPRSSPALSHSDTFLIIF